MTTTIEITTIQLVMVVTVEIIVTTTIEVEMVVIVTINQISTKIEIKSTLINCKTLMTSIIMKVKEWSMPMLKKDNNKIEAFSTISQEEEEVEVEVVEAVGSTEITPGTTIKTQKLLEKVWLPTSNMSIQIIEVVVATIVANEAVEETITPEVTIEETIVVTIEVITVVTTETIVIIIMSQEITIGKMILTRSHIMNLKKISNKKR